MANHIANVHEGKKSAKYPKIKLKGTGNLESHTTELKFGVHEEKKPTERDLEDHNVHEEKKSMSPKIEFEVICDYVHNLTMMMLMTKKKHRMKNLIHLQAIMKNCHQIISLSPVLMTMNVTCVTNYFKVLQNKTPTKILVMLCILCTAILVYKYF